jgi:hypothetical protein
LFIDLVGSIPEELSGMEYDGFELFWIKISDEVKFGLESKK